MERSQCEWTPWPFAEGPEQDAEIPSQTVNPTQKRRADHQSPPGHAPPHQRRRRVQSKQPDAADPGSNWIRAWKESRGRRASAPEAARAEHLQSPPRSREVKGHGPVGEGGGASDASASPRCHRAAVRKRKVPSAAGYAARKARCGLWYVRDSERGPDCFLEHSGMTWSSEECSGTFWRGEDDRAEPMVTNTKRD